MSTHDNRDISPHFCDKDADLVILSSDKVEFHVFKLFLKRASAVFEGMFTLPTPDASKPLPVVDVSENGDLMTQLLRLCYPVPDPPVASLDEARALLAACQKYEMQVPTARLIGIITRTFKATDPLHVYILACNARAQEEARAAAFHCLSMPFDSLIYSDTPDSCGLSMEAFRNLLRYYDTCRKAATAALSGRTFSWVAASSWGAYCWAHGCGTTNNYVSVVIAKQASGISAPWFCELVDSIIAHLQHKAAPLSPQLFNFIDPPQDKMCSTCRSRYALSLYHFLTLLDGEVKRRVGGVKFNVVF